MEIQAIAFDFDGTIIDVSRRDYAVYSNLITDLGGQALPYRIYWPMRRAKTNIYSILAQSGITDKELADSFLAQRSVMIEDERYLNLDSLIPGVVENISFCKTNKHFYLVTTRFNKANLYKQLKVLHISDLFEEIIVSDKDKCGYYSRIDNLRLIVGDTENDINAANLIGVPSVAVLSGIRNAGVLEKYNPNRIIDSVAYLDFDKALK